MVTERSVALFVHLLGVVTLFSAIVVVQLGGLRVRRSTTVEELRLWLGLTRVTGVMFGVSFALILASGLYLANLSWTFDTPFVAVAIGSVVIMGIVGGAVVGRGLATIGRAATSSGALTPDLARTIARPMPWVAASVLNGMALGVLWLMVNKPGWTHAITVQAAVALAGALFGSAMTRRSKEVRDEQR